MMDWAEVTENARWEKAKKEADELEACTEFVKDILDAFSEFNDETLEDCDKLTVIDGYVMSEDEAEFLTHLEDLIDDDTSVEAYNRLRDRLFDIVRKARKNDNANI